MKNVLERKRHWIKKLTPKIYRSKAFSTSLPIQ
jgi:hypothetical protein